MNQALSSDRSYRTYKVLLYLSDYGVNDRQYVTATRNSAMLRRKIVPAEGIGIFSGIENTQVIDFRDAKNAEHEKIAANWNVSGTRDFSALLPILWSFSGTKE